MALIYDLARFAESGMKAMQGAQRDWSPYLVHFTQAASLKSVQGLFDGLYTDPKRVKQCLDYADRESSKIAAKIITSGALRAFPIKGKETNSCVCFSECTLPGLFGHSERFGRFGFVFEKSYIFSLGGRPMAYVDGDAYGWLKTCHEKDSTANRIWRFSNVYCPVGSGKVQDFTIEREWRVFDNVSLGDKLRAVIVPNVYIGQVGRLLQDHSIEAPILPIDMLYDWGV